MGADLRPLKMRLSEYLNIRAWPGLAGLACIVGIAGCSWLARRAGHAGHAGLAGLAMIDSIGTFAKVVSDLRRSEVGGLPITRQKYHRCRLVLVISLVQHESHIARGARNPMLIERSFPLSRRDRW